MRTHPGSAGARVLAFGGYQPARIVTNDELAESVETSDVSSEPGREVCRSWKMKFDLSASQLKIRSTQ